MTIDFAQLRIKFVAGSLSLGRREEHLLNLTSSFRTEWEPSFDLQLDEELGEHGTYEFFLTNTSTRLRRTSCLMRPPCR